MTFDVDNVTQRLCNVIATVIMNFPGMLDVAMCCKRTHLPDVLVPCELSKYEQLFICSRASIEPEGWRYCCLSRHAEL